MLKIGITTRVVNSETYPEKRDAISQDWTKFLEKINVIPIFIPNVLSNPILFLQENQLDGLILSGGDDVGFPPERQKTEQAIIEFGIELNSEPNLRKIDKLKHIAVTKMSCK